MKKAMLLTAPALLMILWVSLSTGAKTDKGQDRLAGYYLTGIIGKNTAVQMSLNYDRNNRLSAGTSFYESQGKNIELKVDMKKDKVHIEEVIKGKITGIYDGAIDKAHDTFIGTWTNPDRTKSLPFQFNIVALLYQSNSNDNSSGDCSIILAEPDSSGLASGVQARHLWRVTRDGDIRGRAFQRPSPAPGFEPQDESFISRTPLKRGQSTGLKPAPPALKHGPVLEARPVNRPPATSLHPAEEINDSAKA